jgi:hypothetical protein
MIAADLDLKANAAASADQLEIGYVATNLTGNAVFVRHLIEDYYGISGKAGALFAPLGQTLFDGTGRVLIYLGTMPIPFPPAGRIVPTRTPRIPFAQRVEPGDSLVGSVVLPLPLLEWTVYARPLASPTQASRVGEVRLVIEYLRQENTTMAREHLTRPGVMLTQGSHYDYAQTIVAIPTGCDLLVRSDAFQRPGLPPS